MVAAAVVRCEFCGRGLTGSWSKGRSCYYTYYHCRLDEAFLYERSNDIDTYDRHAEKLRQELALARMDRKEGLVDLTGIEPVTS